MRAARALALGLSAWFAATLLLLFVLRIGYPYDLEWLEGGMLCHALRLLEGKPIYAAPSVDFIAFPYTPLYPAIVALGAKLFGLGYGIARIISLTSFFIALTIGYWFVRAEGGSRSTAAIAMALPLAAFVPTGAWYDLARPDSLCLAFSVAGMTGGWRHRRSHIGVAAAAMLLVAAFFAKQTAAPLMLALGAALAVFSRRTLVSYLAALAISGLPALYWINHTSSGWFWFYIYRLHQAHSFHLSDSFWAPVRMLYLISPGLGLIVWALVRTPTPHTCYAAWLAGVGLTISALARGTDGAFANAYIPAVFFGALGIGVAAGRLVEQQRGVPVYLALAASLLIAPGGLRTISARLFPRSWPGGSPPHGYDLRPFLPTTTDRARGDALIARLRAAEGEVLIPFHPYYARLAGKRTFVSHMGLRDLRGTTQAVTGLAAAISEQRWTAVAFDEPIDRAGWALWPGLLDRYRIIENVDGPRVVVGGPRSTRWWLVKETSH